MFETKKTTRWLQVAFFLIFVAALLSANIKMKIRYYNDNILCLYNGVFHGRFYINGVLMDEGGMFDYTYYGQLPTGEEVVAKMDAWSGDISIYIGNTTNNQNVHLS